MLKPNWFDEELGSAMEKATAEQCLADIAKSPRIIKAVKAALAEHDKPPLKMGPSRSQVVRRVLAEVVNVD